MIGALQTVRITITIMITMIIYDIVLYIYIYTYTNIYIYILYSHIFTNIIRIPNELTMTYLSSPGWRLVSGGFVRGEPCPGGKDHGGPAESPGAEQADGV